MSKDLTTIRALAMDAVQAANSGHPACRWNGRNRLALWGKHLRHNRQPEMGGPRPLRALERPRLDAAVRVAASHGLHLRSTSCRRFRSCTRRPPATRNTAHPGVETTTGPLGQGLANAVAWLSRSLLAAQSIARLTSSIIQPTSSRRRCLMEGISPKPARLRHAGLEKLIAFYDDNGISIDGPVSSWFTDKTP